MTDFVSPVGRMVQGDAFKANTKDAQGNPLTVKTGPNAGQPTQQYIAAVAYAKNDPEALAFLGTLRNSAAAAWPQYFAAPTDQPPAFGCSHPNFSLKIIDGDGVDQNGKQNNTKPGFAGHWVVRYGSQFAPNVYEAGKYDDMQRVDTDPAKHGLLKRGFYVRVAGTYDSNKNDQRPGMYANLNMVEIVRPGEVIQTGPDAASVFGGSVPTPAAGAAPVAPAPTPAAGVPASAPATPSPTDVAPPAPYGGYMAPAAPVAPAPAADPLGAPAGFKMAGPHAYDALKAQGWTDELMIQHGMMLPA